MSEKYISIRDLCAHIEREYAAYGGEYDALQILGDIEDELIPVVENIQKDRGWISVKDRLPEDHSAVNVVWVNHDPTSYYANIRDVPQVATAHYFPPTHKWYWYSATCEAYLAEYGYSECDLMDTGIEVTHWMPLPEPPEVTT